MTRNFKNLMVFAAGLMVFSCSNVKKDGEVSESDSVQTEVVADSVETMATDSVAIVSDSVVVSEGDSATVEE